ASRSLTLFLFSSSDDPPDLHSFPTRRSSDLADYAAISAPDLPSFELADSETPTDLNPLGVKGIGEAGTIGSTPAIQNAVIDAVAHLRVRPIDMPATPQRVWTAMNEAQKASHQ